MFLLEPAYKDYIWGGAKLACTYGKRAPFSNIAESWELSVHPDGLTRVKGGAYDGQTLAAYLTEHPEGIANLPAERFPILVKLIDARTPLSVQVHPDDDYARAHDGGSGKTELWHILDAEPGAYLYLGLSRAVTKEELAQRIADGTVEETLKKVFVHPGETYYIPAGTLHAIGGGVLLCEVQESSNLTYRVYDYGRKDAAGNLRELHIEQALAVASLVPTDCTPPGQGECLHAVDGWEIQTLVSCPYFQMRRLGLMTDVLVRIEGQRCAHLLCIAGEMEAEQNETRLMLKQGDGLFIPAGEEASLTGRGTTLIIRPGTGPRSC